MSSPVPNESRKRKLSSDDLYEDGEIQSDDESPLKIVKINNDNQLVSHNLELVKTIENSNDHRRIGDVDKDETIDGFVVIEDSEQPTTIINHNLLDNKEFIEKEKNCCSQTTETTDSGIGSQSLDIDENLQRLHETPPISEETLIEQPCITIQFKDNSISDQYRIKFLKFINNFVELNAKFTENLNIEIYQDSNFDPKEWEVVDETLHESLIDEDNYCSPKKHRKKSKAKKELFVLDANPSSAHKNDNDLRYTSKFVINSDKKLEEKQSTLKCFNCGDDHTLKDCKQPRDSRRINAARDKSKQIQKPTRYHVDQKFNHLSPGKFSSELRTALALRHNEIPPFIYRMRTIGYPPGWLEEAKIVYSNLDMFDIDGKNLKTNGRQCGGLDPTKIIDYPGFNRPLDKQYRDEYKFYGVPPYSDIFNKESMIKCIDEQLTKINDNLEMVDMDLDDTDVTMITTIPDVQNCQLNNGLTLNELEQQKQELLNELKDAEQSLPVSKADDDDDDNNTQLETINNSIVKSTCYGTPILKSNSPYVNLPNPDNFSKDVSPMINFENLPNSTGKYEQMVDVLQKVRETLKNQSCTT